MRCLLVTLVVALFILPNIETAAFAASRITQGPLEPDPVGLKTQKVSYYHNGHYYAYQKNGRYYDYRDHGRYYNHRRMVDGHWHYF
jgi:hypothetical protein